MNNTISTTETPDMSSASDEVAIGRASFLSIIAFLVIASNIFCIYALRKSSFVNHQTRVFLCSLAVSDACVGLLVLVPSLAPLALGHWPYGETACAVHSFIIVNSYYAEQFSFLFVTIDRYVFITKPLSYHRFITVQKARVLVITIWTLATGAGIATGFRNVWKASFSFVRGTCVFASFLDTSAPDITYIISWSILLPCPLILILILNARIFREARRQARRVENTLRHEQRIRHMSIRTNSLNTETSWSRSRNDSITPERWSRRRSSITHVITVSETLTQEESPQLVQAIPETPTSRIERKVTVTMLIITFSYVIAWTSVLIINALFNFSGKKLSYEVYFFRDVVFYSNSFRNSIIYYWRFRSFRKAIKDSFTSVSWTSPRPSSKS